MPVRNSLYEEVLDVAGLFADGATDSGGSVRVHYPASYFLARRCELLTWTPYEIDRSLPSGSAARDTLLR